MATTIVHKILEKVQQYPNRHALWVDNCYYTYKDLFIKSCKLANILLNISKKNSRCALFTKKNIYAFQSIIGSLLAGKTYLPLHPNYSTERNLRMIEIGKPEIICVDVDFEYEKSINDLLKPISSIHVCVFNNKLYSHLIKTLPHHTYHYVDEESNLFDYIDINNLEISLKTYVYLMFTSGSTGEPKGIAVNHDNLLGYVNAFCKLYRPNIHDRFSQISELTFDVSVHEMFVCWSAGATLYVIPENYIFGIQKFINTHQITYWVSVPSIVTLLNQLGQLKTNIFPSLTRSFFCGEVLLRSQAELWQSSASNSQITNLYGPTEATSCITYFDWNASIPLNDLINVPIGIPFSTQHTMLINKQNMPCKEQEVGELCLAGSQITDGYWQNVQQTNKYFKYFSWDQHQRKWYCTGDLAKWDAEFGYIYLGRLDDQWKIRGYRVEKLEIENELRKISGVDEVAVIPIKISNEIIEGVVAFVGQEINIEILLKKCRMILPNILVPRQIYILSPLPKNSNGKVDYPYLKTRFESLKNNGEIL